MTLEARFVGVAGVAQLVERQPSKLNVDGSNPFTRFYISHVELSLYEGLPGIVFRLRQPLSF